MIYADVPLTEDIRAAVAAEWGYKGDGERLFGGEESAAYRLGDVVVRIGALNRDPATVEWCNGIAVAAARTVPEAVAPLHRANGETVAMVAGRPITVWPLVEGQWASIEDPIQMAEAARLLARLHRALADHRPPPRPEPSFLAIGLDGAPSAELPDPELDRWLAEFTGSARVHPLHGDYYEGNLLARGGHVIAALDWDEALVAPPEVELASAALEFADVSGADLTGARWFVDEYHAEGGTADRLDDIALVQLMRHRLRREAVYFGIAVARGVQHDEDDLAYHRQRMDTFRLLRP
ncbi:Ser/Thr protein kinase RdoA (MazF antagonist) [Nocardia tenerifensis]|uniref:Ser/Thr protein kinase RdoA (MazF antagonist) n=1 Tax=Nocardia tenerifensis TaxID=228006 RepID=A0A318JPV6_9NOCA|nr:phosphotransferase [Nocardia tenerifensis]PXX57490.1 Ser/Thr protein kinase RdoA (MazF antagonist) [Nocardia tenerifensis]